MLRIVRSQAEGGKPVHRRMFVIGNIFINSGALCLASSRLS